MSVWDDAEAEDEKPKPEKLFTTTHWSVVLRAKDNSLTALDTLFNQYRKPLVVHLLRRGRTPEQAEDLVQGFCANLLKPDRKHFLANVSKPKGKFRTFLLNSLINYILDEVDKENTLKRGEGKIPDSLDEVDSDGEFVCSQKNPSAISADLEYDRAWARTILRNSLHRLEKGYARRDGSSLFIALEPALHDDETSPSYREIAARLGMTEGAVKKAAFQMRKNLQKLIQDELMQTVSNEVEFNEERAYLISLFRTSQT